MKNLPKPSTNTSLQEIADPTIVGGRPMGKGRSLQGIPRGIEVLIKKASVDPEFRALLLEKRASAASEIELELSAAESAMLNALPASQIEQIIEHTTVPVEYRRAFLWRVAAAMLAAIGLAGCEKLLIPLGIQRGGIRPDHPNYREPVTPTGGQPDDPNVREEPKPLSPEDNRLLHERTEKERADEERERAKGKRIVRGTRPDPPKKRPEPPKPEGKDEQ